MTVNQVFQLLEKGFSRDDIMELVKEPAQQNQEQSQDQSQEQGSDQEQDQNQEQSNVQSQGQNQEPEESKPADLTGARLDKMEATMQSLIKTIQAQNLKNDSFGSAGQSLDEQTDAIMASIIRPEHDKNNK